MTSTGFLFDDTFRFAIGTEVKIAQFHQHLFRLCDKSGNEAPKLEISVTHVPSQRVSFLRWAFSDDAYRYVALNLNENEVVLAAFAVPPEERQRNCWTSLDVRTTLSKQLNTIVLDLAVAQHFAHPRVNLGEYGMRNYRIALLTCVDDQITWKVSVERFNFIKQARCLSPGSVTSQTSTSVMLDPIPQDMTYPNSRSDTHHISTSNGGQSHTSLSGNTNLEGLANVASLVQPVTKPSTSPMSTAADHSVVMDQNADPQGDESRGSMSEISEAPPLLMPSKRKNPPDGLGPQPVKKAKRGVESSLCSAQVLMNAPYTNELTIYRIGRNGMAKGFNCQLNLLTTNSTKARRNQPRLGVHQGIDVVLKVPVGMPQPMHVLMVAPDKSSAAYLPVAPPDVLDRVKSKISAADSSAYRHYVHRLGIGNSKLFPFEVSDHGTTGYMLAVRVKKTEIERQSSFKSPFESSYVDILLPSTMFSVKIMQRIKSEGVQASQPLMLGPSSSSIEVMETVAPSSTADSPESGATTDSDVGYTVQASASTSLPHFQSST